MTIQLLSGPHNYPTGDILNCSINEDDNDDNEENSYRNDEKNEIIIRLTLYWPGFQNYTDGQGRADLPY